MDRKPRWWISSIGLLLSSLCSPGQTLAGWTLSSSKEIGPLQGGAQVWERHLVEGQTTVRVTAVTFSAKNYSLTVLDNPESNTNKLAGLAPARGAVAGCNASYFHSDWRPIGLVISGGQQIHPQERAALLSGILAVRNGRPELVRSGAFRGTEGVTQAIQAGPWLLEEGQAVAGLDAEKRARRTLVANDGRGRWALAVLSPVSLAQAAQILASGNAFPDWQPRNALNLDGGRSTTFWADTSPTPVSIPEFGYVRNFLILIPKS